jgi:hypothetical protein
LAKARSPHHLIAAELALIVEFKRWPGLRASVGRRVLAGPAPDELTSRALGQARDGNIGAAMDTLCQIREVGVPTASAILAAVYPDRFAVIDRYVMAEIGFVLTACAREGWPADESLALLAESLAEWVQHAAVAAYPLFVAGLIKKAELVSDRDHESFQTRDIEKAMYGHFLKRTGRKVL